MAEAIPVIDVADHLAGRPGALGDLARRFHDALTTVGFMVITGHDVPQALIDQTFAEARRLHDLPMPDKLALKLNEHNNGYMAMSRYAVWTSDVNKNDKPDLNEAFFIKRERGLDNPLRQSGRRFVGANVWPDESVLPRFRGRALQYADTLDTLARRMLAPLAVALNLSPDWFDEAFSESQFTLRLSHYPPVQAAANQFGIAPHTDSSFMTFLAQTEVPGLQVRTESGDWLDVPYVPGSFAVNSGDMMKRWTNGRFKSTPHRALPPVGRHRYAIPFFLGPQFDWEIACLPTCTGPDNPPRWPPITYAAWQEYWYDANYDPKAQQDLVA
ncbi:MAG TPA: 2OG-Fe(II) oxygenase family protein [Acetobacteraceae bacterium]|jgi:isopenicillin N synthase-like dioxygenase|nr:2OG-Fe(II) oxygenase family protein [Acetobacteraceae bacterium]